MDTVVAWRQLCIKLQMQHPCWGWDEMGMTQTRFQFWAIFPVDRGSATNAQPGSMRGGIYGVVSVNSGQIRQCPQAERARRSELSQPPPRQRPSDVSDSIMTVPGSLPGWRQPLQCSQLAHRLRSTVWLSKFWWPCRRRWLASQGRLRRRRRSSP